MEPRFGDRGTQAIVQKHDLTRLLLQWSRGSVTAERIFIDAANAMLYQLQWSRGSVTAERSSRSWKSSWPVSCFNGAAVR